MVTVLDTRAGPPEKSPADQRPRHPEKAARPDTPLLRKPEWIRVRAPNSPDYDANTRDRAREQAAYRLRGGRLPQHRRMLDEASRDHDDHGRHLHARLCLLQRRDRAAEAARPGEPESVADAVAQARPRACRHHLRRPRRSGRRRRGAFCRRHPRHPRAHAGHDDRGADPRFPAQGGRARDGGRRPSPTSSTTTSRRCRGSI